MRNHRSDFTRGDQPALDEVAQTDLLLDALAARTETRLGAAEGLPAFEDQALAELLGDWRDDLRWPPASALVSQDEAEDALRHGMAHRPRGGRGLAAVGSVAATLLALSGFGAVVADAKPGDLLYGLHAMMFNEPRVNDDQIMLSAKADLAKVEQMIAQGQWDQAQNRLAEVSTTLQGVNDRGRKQGLLAEVNQSTPSWKSATRMPPRRRTRGHRRWTRAPPRLRRRRRPRTARHRPQRPPSPSRRPLRLLRLRPRHRRKAQAQPVGDAQHAGSRAERAGVVDTAGCAVGSNNGAGGAENSVPEQALTNRTSDQRWRRKPSASEVASLSDASA